jgi:hypothetical protein
MKLHDLCMPQYTLVHGKYEDLVNFTIDNRSYLDALTTFVNSKDGTCENKIEGRQKKTVH